MAAFMPILAMILALVVVFYLAKRNAYKKQ